MSEPVRFRCTLCGEWGVSRVYKGSKVANIEAELGRGIDVDENEEYVNCVECGAWCKVDK